MTGTRLISCVAMLMAAAAPHAGAQLLLNDANLTPSLVLPPPPVDGSALAAAELQQLHAIDAARTPAEIAHAQADDHLKNVTIFADAIGPGFDLTRLPETTKLFDTVRAEEKASADRAKDYFKRNRPWIVDKTLHPCSTDDAPQSSYPSGHTTMGFAMGSILSRLAPDKAAAIMARAADYAHSRLVCEMHFQADVTAGALWGTMIAERLMQQPAFKAQFDRALNELRAAKVIERP
jgi:acid phosphatase (class A)